VKLQTSFLLPLQEKIMLLHPYRFIRPSRIEKKLWPFIWSTKYEIYATKVIPLEVWIQWLHITIVAYISYFIDQINSQNIFLKYVKV
jgi:hypothetical protein